MPLADRSKSPTGRRWQVTARERRRDAGSPCPSWASCVTWVTYFHAQKAKMGDLEDQKSVQGIHYYARHAYPVLRFASAFGGGSGGALVRHRSSGAGCRPIARQPVDDARAG